MDVIIRGHTLSLGIPIVRVIITVAPVVAVHSDLSCVYNHDVITTIVV